MRKLRLIFSILTVVFASLGLAKILSYDISLPLMFISMILTFLVWSKECYDKGAKRDSHIFLGVAIFIAAITVFNIISNFSSKENNAEIQNGETVQMYSQEEINSAIDVIKKEFKRDWNGCTLKEISYTGDKVSKEHQEFAERYNADEAIVLVSTFDVDESGGDDSLNPNSTYTDWNWILVRKNGGKWKHVDHGY